MSKYFSIYPNLFLKPFLNTYCCSTELHTKAHTFVLPESNLANVGVPSLQTIKTCKGMPPSGFMANGILSAAGHLLVITTEIVLLRSVGTFVYFVPLVSFKDSPKEFLEPMEDTRNG